MAKGVSCHGRQFYLDGVPTHILSGAIHYFRIVPAYWEDRLLRAKACGLNTIETYIPWNLHEPKKGEYCFEGIADVVKFVQTAGELGLKVILRPGPFICAEWDFGGLPAWLLCDPDIKLRCVNSPFLQHVDSYFQVLLKKIRPLLATNGGPVIAVQLENEYGSYGNDHEYLVRIRQMLEQNGVDVLIFTSDGSADWMLDGGTLPDVFKTVNFGSGWQQAAEALLAYQPDMPMMCMEFWDGWFDHWEDEHIVRAPEEVADEVGGMLAHGMSVNLYMMHGGTNFGFCNGANFADKYLPTVTSYDYDAPIAENGDLKPKYHMLREVFRQYASEELPPMPANNPRMAYGEIPICETQDLFACLSYLSQPTKNAATLTMEECGQSSGFMLYRTVLQRPFSSRTMTIEGLRDRAQVFLDGEYRNTLYRNDETTAMALSNPRENGVLDILVENMGRINYGPMVGERKGIDGHVRFERQLQFGWEMYPLSLDDLTGVPYDTPAGDGPAFYRAFFSVDTACDTYFSIDDWHKGVVFVNGFNIGRYWEAGPQKTLYIPAPLLKRGENEIVVFELYAVDNPRVVLTDQLILN